MKFKTTAKAVKANYGLILRVGYCELQLILRDEKPIAYSAGVYGWNWDLYDIDGVAICTGYRGMPGEDVPYEILKRYEAIAGSVDWYGDKAKEECAALLSAFIADVVKSIESKRSKKGKV